MANYKKISEFGNVTPVSTDLYLVEKADGTYSYVTGTQLLAFFGGGGGSQTLSQTLTNGNIMLNGQKMLSENTNNDFSVNDDVVSMHYDGLSEGIVEINDNGTGTRIYNETVNTFDAPNNNFPQETPSKISVFDASGNLKSGTIAESQLITKQVIQITSSTAPTVNTTGFSRTFVDITALAGNVNLSTNLTGTPQNGDILWFQIKDNGTARTITCGSLFEQKGVDLPLTTIISKRLNLGCTWDSTTSKWGAISCAYEY